MGEIPVMRKPQKNKAAHAAHKGAILPFHPCSDCAKSWAILWTGNLNNGNFFQRIKPLCHFYKLIERACFVYD
jgi:hypothetical protein